MNWTKDEKDNLKSLIRQGLPWKKIAAAIPGRSMSACHRKAHSMRERGKVPRHPGRVKPGGAGAGAGRPRNSRVSVKLSLRLGADVRAAWLELCEGLGRKPGEVLGLAFSFGELLTNDPKHVTAAWRSQTRPRVVRREPPVAVCWCVQKRYARAATKRLETTYPKAAKLTVLAMLRAYGYTIEDKTS